MDSLSKSHVSNEQLSKETHPLKKRKVLQKTVVTVKVGTKKTGKLKNEGPPPDFWSWRKYGQKPIKGSPYPRGYYRCSSSKGCSAKKQVERSKTDGSMFIITYTSSHNHPGPNISTINLTHQEEEIQSQPSDQDLSNQDQQDHDEKQRKIPNDGDAAEEEEHLHFHFSQSPLNGPKELEIAIDEEEEEEEEELEKPIEKTRECNLDEENDFFDELEELPIPPSSFSSLMRSYYFDEIRVPS